MQTLAFVVLICAIVKIRSFLNKTGMHSQINSRMICLHGLCVGGYMFSNLLLILVIIINRISNAKRGHGIYVLMGLTWILVSLFQFVTQISLILIFLEIGKKNPLKDFESARYSS